MGVLSNNRHEVLAQHIARGLSRSLAGRRAGYLNTGSAQAAARRPEVVARVDELLAAAVDSTVMDAKEVLQQLSAMARSDIREILADEGFKLCTPQEWTNEIANRVTSIKPGQWGVEVKIESKLNILEKLGRAHGMFKDGVQLTGANGGPIQSINGTMSAEQAAELYKMML